MSTLFKELDFQSTPIGDLSLRRRRDLSLDIDVFEIKLGEEFLMSSLFTASEVALANLGLDALTAADPDVVIGGLGLGYTARAVLDHEIVRSVIVVEMLEPVINWHRDALLPLGPELTDDARCSFIQGDFFAMARSEAGFDPVKPARRFDAVLVDIDHSPSALLDDRSTSFYQPDGLRAVSRHIRPGGIFGLWSNDKPDQAFTEKLETVFDQAWAEPVTFHNPIQDRPFTQTVYLARTRVTDVSPATDAQ